ncbi:MAG: hypothetical protein Q7U57_09725 [Methylovulum sp.]|nr:hypothetical protein [Methylovulum sp.]
MQTKNSLSSKIGVDWTQRSTRLGAIVLIASGISLVLIIFNQSDKAAEVMTLAGTVTGMLGLAVKD